MARLCHVFEHYAHEPDVVAIFFSRLLATLPFIEHELVTFDYIELNDASPA
jgi:hypothetical protein